METGRFRSIRFLSRFEVPKRQEIGRLCTEVIRPLEMRNQSTPNCGVTGMEGRAAFIGQGIEDLLLQLVSPVTANQIHPASPARKSYVKTCLSILLQSLPRFAQQLLGKLKVTVPDLRRILRRPQQVTRVITKLEFADFSIRAGHKASLKFDH